MLWWLIFSLSNTSKWDNDQKELISNVLKPCDYINNLEVLEETIALQILAQILKVEMEEYLKVPFDELDNEKEKQNHITFKQFKQSKTNVFDFNLELEKVFSVNTVQHEYIPNYFKLLRARNCILTTFNKRMYSDKTLRKFIESIFESFKEDLTHLILKENISHLESTNINNIADKVVKDYISDFINIQQLGKTESQGKSLEKELKEKIFSKGVYVPLLKNAVIKFENVIHELLDENRYREFSSDLINYIGDFLEEQIGVQKNRLHMIRYQDFQKIILGEIIITTNTIDELLSAAYKEYTNEMIVERIFKVQKEYLAISRFEVALRVSNLSVKNNLFYLTINEDIEAVSHELFKSWQYENYKELGQERLTIIDIPEKDKEDSMWFIVKNLDCANKDEEIAYLIAKEKLETYLEFYYYFMSKENEYKLKIEDPYIIYNKTSKRINLGKKEKFNNNKYFDEFPKELIEFSDKVLQSNNQLSLKLIKCIRLYYSTMNEKNFMRKSQNLIDIWKIIFGTIDNEVLAKYAAIIIAGTNYNESDITYGQMRQILYTDFYDFIRFTSSESYILVLEENFGRFKVFTRNIIGNYLFNLSFEEKNEIIDVLKWILYINPNNENIKSGVIKND